MRRRRLLRRTALLGSLGLAGCTGVSAPEDDGTSDPDSTTGGATDPQDETDRTTNTEGEPTTRPGFEPETGTGTGTGTGTSGDDGTATPTQNDQSTDVPAMPDGITDYTFEVTDSTGGGQTDSASITFDADATTVTVTGIIWGSDACQTAELAALDLTDEQLTVRVHEMTEPGSADRACAQVIVETGYEATVTLESLPETVVVTHDHGGGPTEVASASR